MTQMQDEHVAGVIMFEFERQLVPSRTNKSGVDLQFP